MVFIVAPEISQFYLWTKKKKRVFFCFRGQTDRHTDIVSKTENKEISWQSGVGINMASAIPPKTRKKIFFGQLLCNIRAFSGKNHVKFGHFADF